MGSRTAVLGVLLLSVLPCYSQSKTDLTIKAKSELVVVPVVVTSNGALLRGLQLADFELRDNKTDQTIATFEEVEIGPASPLPRVEVPSRTTQNFVSGGESRQDVVILLLDFLNASWSSGARIRSYLKDIALQLQVSKMPFSVCLLTSSGMVQIQSLGNTAEDFVAAIEAWQRGNPISKSREFLQVQWTQPYEPVDQLFQLRELKSLAYDYRNAIKLDMAAMTLQTFEQLAEAYRGVPGRKKLIWMTIGIPGGGFNYLTGAPTNPSLDFHIADKSSRALKALNTANIVVYPIDSNGVVNPTWEEKFSPSISPYNPQPEPSIAHEIPTDNASLLEFADKTGGKNCTTNPDVCVGRVLEDARHYYVIGFYLHGDTPKGWHKLSVKVKRDDVAVRSRPGFLVGEPSQAADVQQDVVMTALASAVDYTSVPLRLRWNPIVRPASPSNTELLITSPPGGIAVADENARVDVDLLFYVVPAGKDNGESFPVSLSKKLTPEQVRTFIASGFSFRKELTLLHGTYQVRVLLKDNVAKKMGTVSTVITTP
jgi:VWFA-related protein